MEMLLAMGLAVMAISMLSYTVLRISKTVRLSEERFARKSKMIDTAEQIRWQLRCLYCQDYSDVPDKPISHTTPGTLKYQLYGKRSGTSDRDILIFNTSFVPRSNGTVEVGYRILVDDKTRKPYLAYRQFPWVDNQGLHDVDNYQDTPWQVFNTDIVGMSLSYSYDGEVWQQEWIDQRAPNWIRITLIPEEGEPFVTQVSPAMPSERW